MVEQPVNSLGRNRGGVVTAAMLFVLCGILIPLRMHAETYGSGPYGAGEYNVGRTATTTVLTSSQNPSAVGSNITLTATVAPSNAAGTVIVYDGATSLGTITLGNGSGTLSTSSLTAGSHALVAVYGGNTHFYASTGTTLTQIVTAASSASSSSSAARGPVSGGGGRGRIGIPSLTSAHSGNSSVSPGRSPQSESELSLDARNLLLRMRDRLAVRIERRIQETPSVAEMLWRILARLDARIAARLR